MGAGPGRSGSQACKLKSEPGLGSRTWDPSLVLWLGALGGGSPWGLSVLGPGWLGLGLGLSYWGGSSLR